MKRLSSVALILAVASLGVPAEVFAQRPVRPPVPTISGEAVDAGGRALSGQRVELVRAGEVVTSTKTGSRGEWSFTNVTPGDYVVRIVVNGYLAGIRVSVAPGQTVANALIVAPGAAAPSAVFGLEGLGLVGGTVVATAVAAAVIATTVILVTGS